MAASYLISFKYSDMKPIRQATSNNQYNYHDNKRLPAGRARTDKRLFKLISQRHTKAA
jgi:hypothetical protein